MEEDESLYEPILKLIRNYLLSVACDYSSEYGKTRMRPYFNKLENAIKCIDQVRWDDEFISITSKESKKKVRCNRMIHGMIETAEKHDIDKPESVSYKTILKFIPRLRKDAISLEELCLRADLPGNEEAIKLIELARFHKVPILSKGGKYYMAKDSRDIEDYFANNRRAEEGEHIEYR